MGNSWEARLKSVVTRETVLTQLSLYKITQRAHNIFEEMKRVNATRDVEKAKAEFNKVIFWENRNESDLCHATVNGLGNRSVACGKPGQEKKGTRAGKNLVMDFFCLSVQRQDGEGINQICGFYAGSGYKNGRIVWSKQGPWGSSTMWASIKWGCGKHMQQHPKSTAEARHILEQFLKHLKTGGVYRWGSGNEVKGINRKEGMLGTCAGTNTGSGTDIPCDGKKGEKTGTKPGGVCLYYGPESEWEANID
uniref:VSG n=1 Tax=Trypanosoma congolense (strain IL3000) TaxID=1068625 RepID=G0W2V5_TRYCI|nr:VSG [Trypanosoma congolense IL3000]